MKSEIFSFLADKCGESFGVGYFSCFLLKETPYFWDGENFRHWEAELIKFYPTREELTASIREKFIFIPAVIVSVSEYNHFYKLNRTKNAITSYERFDGAN